MFLLAGTFLAASANFPALAASVRASEPPPASPPHPVVFVRLRDSFRPMSHWRTWKRSPILIRRGSPVATSFDFGADVVADVEELRMFSALDEENYCTNRRSGISRRTLQPSLPSSTIRSALVALLQQRSKLHIRLLILESRPKCEGASLTVALLQVTQQDNSMKSRLNITIAPDSYMAHLTQQAVIAVTPAILLLGAHRISPSGHESNKTGSCSTAVVAKALALTMKVVVLSETDKIAKPTNLEVYQRCEEDLERGMHEHAPEQNDPEEVTRIWSEAGAGADTATTLQEMAVEVQDVYSEWVPAKYINVYVRVEGVFKSEQMHPKSMQNAELEERMFGQLYSDD